MSTISHSPTNFIRAIIDHDQRSSKQQGRVTTRFPPEPNGYLHIGHAKSICLNFGVARDYDGVCHLRFDDTNPEKESVEYAQSIIDAVHWLGFSWQKDNVEHLYYASDYYDTLYHFAEILIEHGYAYVDSQSSEAIRAMRGTLTAPGTASPYRERSAAENLDLFRRMRAGEFNEGEHVLRAKIEMASPNLNLRDPVLYRIRYAHHYRTGDTWCIYPMYDYTHCISDALENITHSLCTLEFEDHRPLYDWILSRLAEAGVFKQPLPQQIEFARLNLNYVVTSKRKLLQLVQEHHVEGWDDPRLPTLAGLRRRGFTPTSIRLFCERIGVAKADSWIEMSVLEQALRDDLEPQAPRAIAVLDPLKLIIDNYPAGQSEYAARRFIRIIQNAAHAPSHLARNYGLSAKISANSPPKAISGSFQVTVYGCAMVSWLSARAQKKMQRARSLRCIAIISQIANQALKARIITRLKVIFTGSVQHMPMRLMCDCMTDSLSKRSLMQMDEIF